MTEHDPVVEVANVSLKGLAFSGAVHIGLVEDKVAAKAIEVASVIDGRG